MQSKSLFYTLIDFESFHKLYLKIYVGTPNCDQRIHMIDYFMKGIPHSLTKDNFIDISYGTEGWTGSDLQVRAIYFFNLLFLFELFLFFLSFHFLFPVEESMSRSRYILFYSLLFEQLIILLLQSNYNSNDTFKRSVSMFNE